MEFRENATTQAAHHFIVSKIEMLFVNELDKYEHEDYIRNRKAVLMASEKAWRSALQLWRSSEYKELDLVIMLGFQSAVSNHQDAESITMRSPEEKDLRSEKIRKFIVEFSPNSMYSFGEHGTVV